MTTVIVFLLVLGLLVFVHEFGHFILAKKFKVRVDEFAFGFPPRIWKKKRGETTFIINAIPLGGYVRLLGEDGKKDDNPANFNNKKPWQKFLIFGSGVFMNFVLAWFLLFGFYLFGGQAIIGDMWKHAGINNSQRVVITEVEENTPAAEAQIVPGNKIISVNGNAVFNNPAVFQEIQRSKQEDKLVVAEIQDEKGVREVELKTFTDKIVVDGEEVAVERIGITMDTVGEIRANWYAAPVAATSELFRLTKLTVAGIYDFLKTLVTSLRISENVGGPVAIAQLTGAATELGLGALIQIIVLLSIALGVFNILPFPALDGGHILFLGLEKAFRREIPVGVKNFINMIGFGLLLLLIIAVTFRDVERLNIMG